MTSRDQDNLPDLPSLETVETTRPAAPLLIAGAWIAVFPALAVWVLVTYLRYIGDIGISAVLLLLAVTAWAYARVASAPIGMKTDADGLTVRRLVSTRKMPWSQVTDASYRFYWTNRFLLVRSPRLAVLITRTLMGGMSPEDALVASIWQHLRRVGGTEPFELDESARSVWQQVGEDVPSVVEWGHPTSRLAKAGAMAGLAVILAVFLSPWLVLELKPGMILMLALSAGGYATLIGLLVAPEVLRQPRRIRIDEARIEVDTLFSQARIAWSEAITIRHDATVLHIRAANPPRDISLGTALADGERRTVLMAAIRKIRSAAPQVPLPLPVGVYGQQRANDPVLRDYERLQGTMLASVMLSLMLGPLVVPFNLPGLISRLAHAGPDARFFFPGTAWPLALCAMIGAPALGAVIGRRLAKRLVRPDAPVWRKVGTLELTVSGRSTRWVASMAIVLGIVLLFLTVNCYIKVTNQGLIFHPFGSLRENCRAWNTVRSVEVLTTAVNPHRKRRTMQTCTVRFRDGSDWTFGVETPTDYAQDDVARAAEFIAAKSGLQVDHR